MKTYDLTKGNETKAMIMFALPLIAGNLFQQFYNVADTLIVGKFIGANALAAVGSSYTLMVFLTSVILGLCMGSGVVFSYFYGAGDQDSLRKSFFTSFLFILAVLALINSLSFLFIDEILRLLQIDAEIFALTRGYLQIIFAGMVFTFLYNYFCSVLRSMGNSVVPLVFLAVASVLNVILDYVLVVPFQMGVEGAAIATVVAQAFSAVAIAIYCICKVPEMKPAADMFGYQKGLLKLIINQSFLTSIQQSIMNFGILMVQGLVNSFGLTVMAGFAAAVKIDSFAYMPVQDFGNAFSTYVAQNRGAGSHERIHRGQRSAVRLIIASCVVISSLVVCFAEPLMLCFVKAEETGVIFEGVRYLRIVSPFYCLIGLLFMLYGLYRGLGNPGMSIVLTVISLGTRVGLAYSLAAVPAIGVVGIWWAIPIGWGLAVLAGFLYYYLKGLHRMGESE